MRSSIVIILIAASLAFPLTVFGQRLHTKSNRALKSYNEGKKAYDYVEYRAAEDYLVDAVKRDNNFIEAFLLLAELLKDQKRYGESAKAYQRVFEIDSLFFVPAFYSMGEVQFSLGNYAKARGYFISFLGNNPVSDKLIEKSKRYLLNCEFALQAILNPVSFSPVSLGDSINTEFDEYWPAITVDNKLFFFTRQISEGARNINGMRYQEDFYYSEMVNNSLGPAKNIGSPLNTPYNEGALSLAAGGQYMYFTACNRMDGMGGCDIYYSTLTSRGWISGMNTGSPINTKYWESQPSLSSDGNKLFFVSNRPGGYGGMDIWYSTRTPGGSWSDPLNLGSDINTDGDEMSPFIHFDGKTLYFSSNGRPCMGGFDLFMSKMINDTTWSEVQNLGYPINTQTDEMGMIINSTGEKAYYSSEINPKMGRDLYYFNMPLQLRPDPVSYVKGSVFDKINGRKLKASYVLTNLKSGKAVIKSSTSDGGEFLICLSAGQNYSLTVEKEKYLFYSENFFLDEVHSATEPYVKRVALSPLRVGEKMALYNVFFETDSWDLMNESLTELNKLYDLLVSNRLVIIEIGGHTDSSGSDGHNLVLSERRAESVMKYLVNKGISESRIVHKGYGDMMPVSDNESSEGMRLNRRTEIKIIGNIVE